MQTQLVINITLAGGNGINGGDFTLNQSADSSISFSVDSDQKRGIISSIGKSDSDYLIFDLKDSAADSDNMKIFFDNTEKFRFTGTGDLHVDNDIIAFSLLLHLMKDLRPILKL